MTTTTSPSPRIVFCNWDNRPAVIVGWEAFAVLARGESWTKVNRDDVGYTSAEFSETYWRRYFASEGYYPLNVDAWRPLVQDNIPQDKPLPRKADFDRAALACVAAQKARLAATALPELPDDETPPTAPL
jgi:hypothetical protein